MRKGEPRMSAADYKLDDADRRILRVLQQDGRITNQDLASACNMSASSCFERVRRLRERGVIIGYTALIDPKFAERELLIFIECCLTARPRTFSISSPIASAARPRCWSAIWWLAVSTIWSRCG